MREAVDDVGDSQPVPDAEDELVGQVLELHHCDNEQVSGEF